MEMRRGDPTPYHGIFLIGSVGSEDLKINKKINFEAIKSTVLTVFCLFVLVDSCVTHIKVFPLVKIEWHNTHGYSFRM